MSLLKNCVCGEIGKHEGLKIPWQKCLVGSSPTLRTISVKHAVKVLGIKILIANVSSERRVKLG